MSAATKKDFLKIAEEWAGLIGGQSLPGSRHQLPIGCDPLRFVYRHIAVKGDRISKPPLECFLTTKVSLLEFHPDSGRIYFWAPFVCGYLSTSGKTDEQVSKILRRKAMQFKLSEEGKHP